MKLDDLAYKVELTKKRGGVRKSQVRLGGGHGKENKPG